MAEKKSQTFANHARFDPLFHFVMAPVFGIAMIIATIHFLFHPNPHSAGFFLVSVAALIAIFKIRLYALKVQDRVIRLEERQRLATFVPEPLRSRIPELTVSQLVALRFASDGEVAKLAERALAENLSNKQIKQAIQTWRPDYWRV